MGPASRPRVRGTGSGFTLLELIVVLALLIAIGGLTLPALLTRVAGANRDSVETRLRAAAALCRADAQRDGVSLELAAREAEGRTLIVSRAAEVEGVPRSEEVLLELPAGYSVGAGASTESGREAEASAAESVVLAVYLPDGSASVPAPRFLVVGQDSMQIGVARWTGALSLRAATLEPDSGLGEDDTGPAPGIDGEEVPEGDTEGGGP